MTVARWQALACGGPAVRVDGYVLEAVWNGSFCIDSGAAEGPAAAAGAGAGARRDAGGAAFSRRPSGLCSAASHLRGGTATLLPGLSLAAMSARPPPAGQPLTAASERWEAPRVRGRRRSASTGGAAGPRGRRVASVVHCCHSRRRRLTHTASHASSRPRAPRWRTRAIRAGPAASGPAGAGRAAWLGSPRWVWDLWGALAALRAPAPPASWWPARLLGVRRRCGTVKPNRTCCATACARPTCARVRWPPPRGWRASATSAHVLRRWTSSRRVGLHGGLVCWSGQVWQAPRPASGRSGPGLARRAKARCQGGMDCQSSARWLLVRLAPLC